MPILTNSYIMSKIFANVVNDNFLLMLNSVEEDWPLLIGEKIYRSFSNMVPNKHMDAEIKINILLNLFHPEEILKDDKKRRILFERITEEKAKELSKLLKIKNCNTSSLYSELFKTKFSGQNKKIIMDYFGIEPIEEIESDSAIIPEDDGKVSYGLHFYQAEVEKKAKHILYSDEKAGNRCLIHMPTGAGKTRTAMDLLCNIMNEQSSAMILWLAYNVELCEQASKEFKSMWFHKGNREVKIINLFGDSKAELPCEKIDGIIFSTLGKIDKVNKRDKVFFSQLSDKISVLVFDEAHQIIAPEYNNLVNQIIINNENCRLIGLSATPGRTWNNIEEDRKLSKFFNENISSINTHADETPTQMLKRMGYLSKIEWLPINFESDIFREKDYELLKKISRIDGDFSLELAEKLSLDSKRNIRIVDSVRELTNNGKKRILIFATSVDHAKILSALLNYAGFISDYIDYGTDHKRRKKIIEDFKNESDEPRVLCNYNVLSTGFDAPKIDAGIIARPTVSVILFSQMVGRMIRGPKSGGTDTATIITVVDVSLPGFKDSYNNWSDVWNE